MLCSRCSPQTIFYPHVQVRVPGNLTFSAIAAREFTLLLLALQFLHGGLYCLKTSVKGARVGTEWLWVKVWTGNMHRKFVGLPHAM